MDTDTQGPDEVYHARQELASLSPDDESYLLAVDNLASELASRFTRSRNPDDLDESISCGRRFLDLSPPGHHFHITALANLGVVLSQRFRFQGHVDDLTQAINYFETAIEACTPEQSQYLQLVASLASSLRTRYNVHGDVNDLDRIVRTGSAALSASPADSPNRDMLLNNLGNALKERFMKQNNRSDLDTALEYYHSCLELRPPGHPLRHSILGNLADAMSLRSETDGNLQDMESAETYYEVALKLLSPGQDGFLLCLTGLAVVYLRFFMFKGDVEKMEMAVGCYKTAVAHSTVPNLEHSMLLDNYGAALRTRFTVFGKIDDLDEAIKCLSISSAIQAPTFPGRPLTLLHLGTALVTRFNVTGNSDDLDSSIKNLATALCLCDSDHRQRPAILSIYGSVLSVRFKAKGEVEDLNLAISMCKEALTLLSPGEDNYSSVIVNLTFALADYFLESGNIEDYQTIIDHCDHALTLTRSSEQAFIPLKICRARAFCRKFQLGREEIAIQTCIDAFNEVIPILNEGHTDFVVAHLQFGMALRERFRLSSDIKDIDDSITHYRIARRHCNRGHSNYVSVCMELGSTLRERFENDIFSRAALDEAIVLLAEAEDILSSTAPEHIDCKASLNNLGVALFMRFQNQRNKDDLDAAIDYISRALTLPATSEEFLCLFSLATLLCKRYEEFENLEDLERSVQLFGTAAERMPPKHVVRGTLCRNNGRALFLLGRRSSQVQHLDAAVTCYEQALEQFPSADVEVPMTNIRLAEATYERAKFLRDTNGGNHALCILQEVMQTLPKDSPEIHAVYHSAASLTIAMYEEVRAPSLMEDSFRYYEQAAHYTQSHSFSSVHAALEWAKYAETLHHPSALLAYQTCLSSLSHHLLDTASIKSRRAAMLNEHWAKSTTTLATDAATCAIMRGELELAVEFLEQGRGLLWSQLSRSHMPLDALRSSGDIGQALASDFESVSAQLARGAFQERIYSFTSGSRLMMEESTRQYGQLSRELDDIVARIRQRHGFESFLDRPSFEALKCAAMEGPVILVNASSQRCDALIILHDAPPWLVPLPDLKLGDITALSEELYGTLKTLRRVGDEKTRERKVVMVLRTLWDNIVRPIVDNLVAFLPRGSRIWWCPTSKLTMLPLHAAGPYRKGGQNLPNLYISSYTPTLAALIRARQRPSTSSLPSTFQSFLAVGQAAPASSTLPQLQMVSAELALVRSLVPTSMHLEVLQDEASTTSATLRALKMHAWAHIACHGRANVEQPFDAAFELRDRAVTVLELVQARTNVGAHGNGVGVGQGQGDGGVIEGGEDEGEGRRSNDSDALSVAGEFAFLSACHTAVGDALAPDEIIHLAAAMQFTGFRSVIGTMWAVDDVMAMAMVEAFYKNMFPRDLGNENGSKPWDCTQAARALNKACKLVDKELVSIDQRIVFIHIGA